MSELIKLTEQLWKEYFIGDQESVLRLADLFEEDCVVIGTGKHEFYRSRAQFRQAMGLELQERAGIRFQFRDFFCEEQAVGPDVSLVYGSAVICWESPDGAVRVDMDTRFSILYKRVDGGWKVVHIHQSNPNLEQLQGESYPKTLTQQVERAQARIKSLQQLAEQDGLTGLINFRSFKERYRRSAHQPAWLYVIDIDNFKEVNDRHGHLCGNTALVRLAGILTAAVREQDAVCRMGGDEFLLLCPGMWSEEAACALASRLLESVEADAGENGSGLWGISVGLTQVAPMEPFDRAFSRADAALYISKTSGKHRFTVR